MNMSKSLIIAMVILLTISISCKKCYVCQARKQGMSEAYDFEKSCGSSAEREKMEKSFRETYKSTEGYSVTCR